MTAANKPVETTLRIPGTWSNAGELQDRLPDGYRLTPDKLVLPDGTACDCSPMLPDDQFADIFRTSCRRPATDDELSRVDRYTVKIGLTGPGGSLSAALTTMQAAAALVRAGGAGVFIDNSALAHGGDLWLELTDDASPDALSFAFVAIFGGEQDVWTCGMHVLGFPEIIMHRRDLPPGADADPIIDVIRYICHSDQPVEAGHLLGDIHGPRFQAAAAPDDQWGADTPMHNPFGRLKLTCLREISESN